MATRLATTRDDIIKSALRKLRVIAEGETPTATAVTNAAEALNFLVKKLEQDANIKFNIAQSWTSVVIGSGVGRVFLAAADLNVVAATYVTGGVYTELTPMSFEEYAATANDADTVTGTPEFYYVPRDTTSGTLKLFVYPAASAAGTILYLPKQRIDTFDSASDTANFPDAWIRHMTYALMLDLAFEYGKGLDEVQLIKGIVDASYQELIGFDAMVVPGLVESADNLNKTSP